MTAQTHLFRPALPEPLVRRLDRVRNRYQAALNAAGTGDFAREDDLRAVSHQVGHLLAQEARKSQADRGGLGMLEISLAVDRLFPELRGWNRLETERRERERIRSLQGTVGQSGAASQPLPVPTRKRQAS